MLKTFALHPDLFADFQQFLILRDKFGVPEGRLIAKFPNKWKKEVRAACEAARFNKTIGEVRCKTVIEWMSQFGNNDPRMIATPAAWQEALCWDDNAQANSTHFDCILSPSLSAQNHCLNADEDGIYTSHPAFAGCRQRNTKRTAHGLIDAVWPLVKISSLLRLVEPHFNPTERRFTNPLVELIDRLHSEGRKQIIELHVCRQGRNDEDTFSNAIAGNYKHHLDSELPTGMQLKVFFWAHALQRLHPRYLLTEHGGIKLDYGWDEAHTPDEETPAIVLEASLHTEELAKYQVGSNAFQIDPKLHILELGSPG